MNNDVKALKSGLWYTASNFLTKGLVFLTTPLFTRLLTQNEYGYFNNFLSWQNILTIITTFEVQASLISAYFDFREQFDSFILSAFALSSLSVCIWILIFHLFPGPVQDFLALDIRAIDLMLLYVLFLKALELFQMKQRYLYGYKIQAAVSLTNAFSSVVLSLALVLLLPDKLTGRLLGNALPTIVIGLVLGVSFFRRGKKIVPAYWKYTMKICLPYIPHLLSMTVLGSTDRIMITKMCGSIDTALYSLAYNCGFIASILATSMNMAYGPWLAEQLNKGDIESVRRFSKPYIAAFCCGILGLMVIAPEVLLLLGGKGYLSAMYVMPPVAMGCACQFLYTMFVNVEQIKKKTIGMAFASASAALLNYILNLIFIPKYGYVAAAYTTLIGYIWLLIIHMFFVYRLKLSLIYSYRFVFAAVLVIGVFALAVNFLYAFTVARYVFLSVYIGGICIALYINRGRIFPAIQMFLPQRKKKRVN